MPVPGRGTARRYETHPFDREEHDVGLDDKVKNEATEAKGKVKESAGSATGNESLESEGKADQGEAKVKETGRHAKEAVKNVKDTFKS
jgi:uncharacterized protein YjbJ (UPF0337 family)